MNLHVHSAHRQRKSLGCEHKKRVEKRWRVTRADIRPGVYGPLAYDHNHVLTKQNLQRSFVFHCFYLWHNSKASFWCGYLGEIESF